MSLYYIEINRARPRPGVYLIFRTPYGHIRLLFKDVYLYYLTMEMNAVGLGEKRHKKNEKAHVKENITWGP